VARRGHRVQKKLTSSAFDLMCNARLYIHGRRTLSSCGTPIAKISDASGQIGQVRELKWEPEWELEWEPEHQFLCLSTCP
jgi:hypothetical protein